VNRLLSAVLVLVPAVCFAEGGAEIGKPVGDFALKCVVDGKEHKLSAHKGKIAVIIFYNHNCGTCPDYDARLRRFNEIFAAKGVVTYALDAQAANSAADCKTEWEAKKLGFPLLKDAGGKVSERLGSEHTPTVYVIDGEGKLRYTGSFDDNADSAKAKLAYTADAVDALLLGKDVKLKRTEPFGCPIIRE